MNIVPSVLWLVALPTVLLSSLNKLWLLLNQQVISYLLVVGIILALTITITDIIVLAYHEICLASNHDIKR